MHQTRKLQAIISNIIAWLFSAICLIPLLLILFNSLKDKKASAAMNLHLPRIPIQWENFVTVVEKGKLLTSFCNSLADPVYLFLAVFGQLCLCCLCFGNQIPDLLYRL